MEKPQKKHAPSLSSISQLGNFLNRKECVQHELSSLNHVENANIPIEEQDPTVVADIVMHNGPE